MAVLLPDPGSVGCFSLFHYGYECYSSTRCLFNSTELQDIEFIRSYYYNKIEHVRFSSDVGRFVGYTEFGIKEAEYWNKDQAILAQMRAQKETYCQHNTDLWYANVLSKSVKPSVRLHSTMAPGYHHPAMLVCSVYDFYPKLIKVSWLRNGQETTSDITSTEEFANGDWLYQHQTPSMVMFEGSDPSAQAVNSDLCPSFLLWLQLTDFSLNNHNIPYSQLSL
uniref:H-2 class II histocompatibility antigen, I-E beta chain-like n=1 Tax=Haplochromis burtoni TaxID=8153 RepID=A0A3Q2X3T0_HAPBU